MGWLSRRRHRLGFGVHSPFAYRMVKDIIAPNHKYRYYAEEAIADHNSPSRRLTRLAIIVHRLVGRHCYRIKTTALDEAVDALMHFAADTASTHPAADAPVLLITAEEIQADTLTRAAQMGVSMLILNPLTALNAPRSGVSFRDTWATLYIPYSKTAFVDYDIRF